MSSIVSLHLIPTHGRNEDVTYTRELQPNVLKFVDADVGQVRRYHAAAPDAWVVLRDWSLSEQKGDMKSDPVGTGRRHAREWADRVDAGYGFVPRDKLLVCGINEPSVWEDLTCVPYSVAFLDTLHGRGLKGVALSLGVGWPANHGSSTPPDWTPYADLLPALLRGNHWLGLHEYWDERGPDFNWGWWAGRYTHCPWAVPILIGECGIDKYVADASVPPDKRGWQGWMGPVGYASQVRRYAERCATDYRIRGCCVFTTDYGHPWSSFDTLPARQPLAAIQIPPTMPKPPTQPPKPEEPPASEPPKSELKHPLPSSTLTQHWGQHPERYSQFGLWGHNGTDLGAPMGTPVRAMAAGEVAWSDTDPNYGEYIRIAHPQHNAHTFYAHLSARHVQRGQRVSAGDSIGQVGSTGNSTGPHLHIEVRLIAPDGSYVVGTPMPKGRVDSETWAIERGLKL